MSDRVSLEYADTRFPMLASLFSFWFVAIPTAYFLGFILHLDGSGLWIGLTIGVAVNALILLIRFKKLINKVDLKQLVI